MAELTLNTSNVIVRSQGIVSIFPGAPLDYDKLITIKWYGDGDDVVSGSEGSFNPNKSDNTTHMVAASEGFYVEYILHDLAPTNMTADSYGEMWIDANKSNWIAWSDIGSLDFTIKRSNVAGNMPLDWKGFVHNIQKLESKVIAYGTKGVSILTPAGKAYGLNTIHKVGLKGRDSFAGNDSVHYFIDSLGCMYSLSDKLKKLDYREYFSLMTNPVMTFDEEQNLLYICDGAIGYIYSPESKSLGAGPVNVTGTSSSSGMITVPTFEICTDIYDFGTRRMKTIYQFELGTDVTGILSAALDYREEKSSPFTTTPWEKVKGRATAKIIRKGVEFRFRARLGSYEDMELDNLTIDGDIHVH
jgi:hypothetical protein